MIVWKWLVKVFGSHLKMAQYITFKLLLNSSIEYINLFTKIFSLVYKITFDLITQNYKDQLLIKTTIVSKHFNGLTSTTNSNFIFVLSACIPNLKSVEKTCL